MKYNYDIYVTITYNCKSIISLFYTNKIYKTHTHEQL